MINNSNNQEPNLKKYLSAVFLSLLVSWFVYFLFLGQLDRVYSLVSLCIFTLAIWLYVGFKKFKRAKLVVDLIMINFVVINWTSMVYSSFYFPWYLSVAAVVLLLVLTALLYVILSPGKNHPIIAGVSNNTLYRWSFLEFLIMIFGLVIIDS